MWKMIRSQLNLHDTYQIGDTDRLQFDCLYLYRRAIAFSHSGFNYMLTNDIPYCLRPINGNNSMILNFVNTVDQNFTFAELRHFNVTAQDLLLWSAPIDLAERYQYYIDQPANLSESNDIFFYCTESWFGSQCQYSFELGENKALDDVIEATFEAKYNYKDPHTVTNLTCYIHLKCDRGGSPVCLDWREICNDRVDCLNGGIDENHCLELEINECNDNEYRCHKGLCIAQEFWQSGDHNEICSDRFLPYFSDGAPECSRITGFICDEDSCPPGPKKFPCGDGECVQDFEACRNGRHLLLIGAMSVQGSLSYNCWVAMACFTKIIDQIDRKSCQYLWNSSYLISYIGSCESLTQFPTIPVLFDHVRFVYRKKNTQDLNIELALSPDYICYDEQLCEFLVPTFHSENRTCRYAHEMGIQSNVIYKNWSSIIRSIEPYFRGCSTKNTRSKNDSTHASLYCCKNSSKCISKHRILDGISDCYMKDDEELFEHSCSMNHTHRFKCHNEDNKCLSPLISTDFCFSYGLRNLREILFHEICDRVVHLLPETINGQNYTDETECEHWQCSNIYTRCDAFWNCPDGRDEVNCTQAMCPSSSLACPSSHYYTFSCLPLDRVNDGVIDCLGAIDESDYCLALSSDVLASSKYRCWDVMRCVEFLNDCGTYEDCVRGDNGLSCSRRYQTCPNYLVNFVSNPQSVLCRISEMKRIYFSLETTSFYPSIEKKINLIDEPLVTRHIVTKDIKAEHVDAAWAWRCNRGLHARLWLGNDNYYYRCFCPPSYYGDFCQYQNQRVVLKLGLALANQRGLYGVVITLFDDDDDREEINSYDQYVIAAGQYCGEFFEIYLWYSARPKNSSKNYSIRVDSFDLISFVYLASWHLKISFLFLPVNRVTAVLNVPSHKASNPSNCPLICKKGVCTKYTDADQFFCRCHTGWSGAHCHIPENCKDCSADSICVGSVANRSICVCPRTKFGSRCLLTYTCPSDTCKNNGSCIVTHVSFSEQSFICICSQQFYGDRCEKSKTEVKIFFEGMEITSHLVIYIITAVNQQKPTQKVMLKKLNLFQKYAVVYIADSFHMVFVEIKWTYYLIVAQQSQRSHISTSISTTQRCAPMNEFLNSTLRALQRIRRIKYYHKVCQTQIDLSCFFDEFYMCLCTLDHHANCFEFKQDPDLTCRHKSHCQNGAECIQDDLKCPLITMCICRDCFFGDRCQFYAKGIGMTLEDILRYEIRPNTTLIKQPLSVKLSTALTTLMFVTGLINSILSFLTFQSKDSRKVGCGIYLFASSVSSFLTVVAFTFNFWFLIITQMNGYINRRLLYGGCVAVQPILKLFLYTDNWLNACVAIERSVNIFKGIGFDKKKSKRIARWTILFLPLFIMSTIVHEPLNRDLFDDNEEHRTWCITQYSQHVQTYNTIILFFHFLVPFSANLLSALFIIFTAARHRAVIQTGQRYKQHLYEQLHEHRHLLSSPIILIVLALPRLLISLLSSCMKATRNPWLYLSGYFISFIPSVLVFAVFVVPSAFYKQQFRESLRSWRRRINQQ